MTEADADAMDVHETIEDVVRSSYGRLLSYLAAGTRDIAAAEDALSEAFVAALRSWPERGVPTRPDSWLLTAARRNLIDTGRRRSAAVRALPELARLLEDSSHPRAAFAIPDVRLQLMFACSHPAIAEGVRSPLMLQTVLGLDAARIAAVFLVPPATMSQRLVRAKTKIRAAGVAFQVPGEDILAERLADVLDAVYAAYTTGWDEIDIASDGSGGDGGGEGLTEEAIRLARIVVTLLPEQPEAGGLLALLLHSHARRAARRTTDGTFVPLDRQDVSLWSSALITEAERHLSRAARGGQIGPYQLMAAIQSVHNRRVVTGSTDRRAVAQLYQGLAHLTPTVGVLVAHAAAVLATDGSAAAMRRLDAVPAERARDYQPYWVVRAAALEELDAEGAAAARLDALRLTRDPATRAHLSTR